ncbi:MAG: hypothetical protein M0R50_08725 [Candidatus Cloacimonetes bacterium]|jgi:hypothetical protein|nr:hypothetical protein [Candidatus Cloacimonadota bacterium]
MELIVSILRKLGFWHWCVSHGIIKDDYLYLRMSYKDRSEICGRIFKMCDEKRAEEDKKRSDAAAKEDEERQARILARAMELYERRK